jgi:ParB family chromosome partitioning protein
METTMVEKRGLGRGLSALLGEAEEAGEGPLNTGATPSAEPTRTVPIELVRRNPDQPRRHFAQDDIDSLAASVREKGVLQPILVRPAPGVAGEYQIVAGERRWRAAQAAGLREVPVVIRDFDDAETLEIAILENVQRADLNPIEEAGGYRALMERFGRTQEQVAQAVGKSRPHIANTLRLLSLPQDVQDHLAEGRLSAGHARALATAADPSALAREVIERGLNVRETEALAKAPPAGDRPAPSSKRKDIDTLALEKRLSDALGLTVEVNDKGGKGQLVVRYATLEQLEDVCRKLGG